VCYEDRFGLRVVLPLVYTGNKLLQTVFISPYQGDLFSYEILTVIPEPVGAFYIYFTDTFGTQIETEDAIL
jgi:hypothetical protein